MSIKSSLFQKMKEYKNSFIHSDPFIEGLLKRLPNSLEKEFTEEQLAGLKVALANRCWNDHPIDFRRSMGLLKWRYYFVFIAGRDLRVSRIQNRGGLKVIESLFLTVVLIFMLLFGLLLVYILKSALGIDIFPGYSFGIWDWFKSSFL